jgi:hypothetical protein
VRSAKNSSPQTDNSFLETMKPGQSAGLSSLATFLVPTGGEAGLE